MTDDVDLLLEQLPLLTDDDIWLLADAWEKEDTAARQRAWARAKKAISVAGLNGELEDVRVEVARWMHTNPSDFHGIEGLLGRAGGQVHGRQAAAPAILDAAAALMAGEALPPEDEEVLMAPWRAIEGTDDGRDPLDDDQPT